MTAVDEERVYDYGTMHICPKCEMNFNNIFPSKTYIKEENVLVKICPQCGFDWRERCADGTPPISHSNIEMEFWILERDGVVKSICVVPGADPLYGNGSWKIYTGPFNSQKDVDNFMMEK